ncbi:uncharacterized protein DNG_09744 [Cephalotrichum gorgonifer]|uniref:Transcription factor domain-containing protein n=1 Tax=Cephalotrichum gorgonifer TaxID=2041049 RepID=A0AAE8SZM3_9PEZI|nr:uncharacterized protein DNG_09744 [Cephalotrichum gorgonifer]
MSLASARPPTFSISPSAGAGAPAEVSGEDGCSSRSLDGQEFHSQKIWDCFTMYESLPPPDRVPIRDATRNEMRSDLMKFARFFESYAHHLPILDASLTPNQYYDLSPFLFWAIVFVGSRHYERDPTLLGILAVRINALALRSLESRSNPIQTIHGLLMLCLWPVPTNTMHKDISHVLCGAALHLAMQTGLHVAHSGQDFARTKLDSDTLYVTCCHLYLLAYHFLEEPSAARSSGLLCLYDTACTAIQTATSDDQMADFVPTCPIALDRYISLAAFSILKIIRSPLAEHIDVDAGERAYFSVIRFNRRVSLQNDDLGARAAAIFSQLWTSSRIFRGANGQVESLRSRIRSRLAMSVVFDCFWWWREEFGGQPSPYAEDANESPEEGIETNGGLHTPGSAGGLPTDESLLNNNIVIFADETFPDYDWAANFDFSGLNWPQDSFPGPLA